MTPPDDFSFKLLDWAWAGILALGGMVWKGQGEKITDLKNEAATQRGHIAKLFDKIESHGQRSEDRHREVLNAIHAGLEKKADK